MTLPISLILALPLAGFFVCGLLGRRLSERAVGWFASGTVGASFVLTAAAFRQYVVTHLPLRESLFTWIPTEVLTVSASYRLDALSLAMALVVTGVGFLIHVYSIGYMKGDPGVRRYFAFLNLFTFMMLDLVMADNLLLLFLGWEGVGLCSYLLIGFWFEDPAKAAAGKKAFVVNRVGDFGFLIAMFIILSRGVGLDFDSLLSAQTLGAADPKWVTAVALLLFLGAVGKSAQIPLYIWLPDAMAGPTPVSALIHAATMVTAGVYLVVRCGALFALSPFALAVVAGTGLATAFLAATMAITETDIKKVLAYSTISQLGFMFVGAGVGAYSAAIFHLVTHAFFKGLLFLGAGSVIHAMGGEQDLRKMGALATTLPVTRWTMLAGVAAIAGIPLLSGFFSKDEILWYAYASPFGGNWLFALALLTAALTAFYMFRLYFLAFHGSKRWNEGTHPHESPKVMTVPLVALAILSVAGGILGFPEALGGSNRIHHFLSAAAPNVQDMTFLFHQGALGEVSVMILSSVVALAGTALAYRLYSAKPEIAEAVAARLAPIYDLLSRKYFWDEAVSAAIVRPVTRGSEWLWNQFDLGVIDRAVDGVGAATRGAFNNFRKIQTGVVQHYATILVAGVVAILLYALS